MLKECRDETWINLKLNNLVKMKKTHYLYCSTWIALSWYLWEWRITNSFEFYFILFFIIIKALRLFFVNWGHNLNVKRQEMYITSMQMVPSVNGSVTEPSSSCPTHSKPERWNTGDVQQREGLFERQPSEETAKQISEAKG